MSLGHETGLSEETTVVFGVSLRISAVRTNHDHPMNVGSLASTRPCEAWSLIFETNQRLVILRPKPIRSEDNL